MSKRFIPLGFAISCCLSSAVLAEDLLETYQMALHNDPQLAAAEATFLAAREAKPLSRAGVLPTLSLSANAARSIDDNTYLNPLFDNKVGYNNYGYSLSLTQTLYRKDNFLQLDEADTRIQQAGAQYTAAQIDLIVRVARAYFNVLAASDVLRFKRAELSAIKRQLDQTKQRFEVGLTAITDVNDAQARHDLTNAEVIQAEFTLADRREALRQIIGNYPGNLARLVEDVTLPAPEPANIEAWHKAALEQNLQLQAARFATEVAAIQIKRSRSGHYPTLDLVASHRNTNGGSFIDESTQNSVGLQFNLPLYTGGAVSAQVRQSRYQFDSAKQNLEQTLRATEANVRNAYRAVTASIVRVQALKQAVVSNQSALAATEAGYDVGTRTSVDVLNARRALFRAQSDYAQSRYDYIIASLLLKQSVGTLSQQDLENINKWLKLSENPTQSGLPGDQP